MEFGRKLVPVLLFVISTTILCVSSSTTSGNKFMSLLTNYALEDEAGSYISGPNGYCVFLPQDNNGNYVPGTRIILKPCGSTAAFIWKLRSDGKLQALTDSCLTASSFTQGSEIFNDVCSNGITWELRNDGHIVNLESGLVLSAITGKEETVLTLETNINSSFQKWHVSNVLTQNVVTIRPSAYIYSGLCLQATDNEVVLEDCSDTTIPQQRFILYHDGTIRPEKNSNVCLTYDNPIDKRVIVLTCGLAASTQGWLFPADETILNSRTNLAMEVINDKEIIVSPRSADNAYQKWHTYDALI